MPVNVLSDIVATLTRATSIVAFTGAGISTASGIPTFRGDGGLWSAYDPQLLELDYFRRNPEQAWSMLRDTFYRYYEQAKANPAHFALADLEKLLDKTIPVITQNIDGLHQRAGSREVIEFHGGLAHLECLHCREQVEFRSELLRSLPPLCATCDGVLKPDFIFFGEALKESALARAFDLAESTEVLLVIGTSGEVYPAAEIPYLARRNQAQIIEFNLRPHLPESLHTISLCGKVEQELPGLVRLLRI
jgi:NAD-dependent deacetylase